MATKIEQIREQYPEYAGEDDETLAQVLYQRLGYADQGKDYEDFKSRLGVETMGVGESALRGAGQGATFGFSDEITAGLRAGMDSFAQGNMDNFGERYNTMLDEERMTLERSRRENPWATGLGEVGGGILTGGAGAARAVAGQTVGKGLVRGMAAGGGIGGTAGLGYSESDPLATLAQQGLETPQAQEQVMGEVSGAAGDVAFGAGLGAVAMPVMGAGAEIVKRVVRAPFTKKAKLNEQGRQSVMDALAEDIDGGYLTLEQARRELSQTPGMTVSDIGPAMRNLTDTLAQTPTAGGRQIREFLTDRNKQQWKRMFPKLAEAVGAKDNFSAARRQLIKGMEDRAEDMYGAAYQRPIRVTGDMMGVLKLKVGAKEALLEANRLRAIKGKGPIPKKIRAGQMVGTEEMDQILQGWDKVISAEFKAGSNKVAMELKKKRELLREEIYRQNPDLKNARQFWAGDKLNDDAMASGLKILRDDADFTADVVRGMSDSEKTFFKIGALRAITRRLGNKSDTADLTKGIFDKPNAREAIKVAFGGKKQFDEFMDYVQREQKMFDTFSQAVGNSATARYLMRNAAETTPGARLASVVGYTSALGSTTVGVSPAMQGYLFKRAYEIMTPKGRRVSRDSAVRQKQADLLMGGGPQGLENVMKPNTVGGLLSPGLPVQPSRMIGGLLSSGVAQPGVMDQYGRPQQP